MKLHYEIATGRIVSWGTEDGIADSHYAGCAVKIYPDVGDDEEPMPPVSGHTHRVDIESPTLDVVALSAAELAAMVAPTLLDVARAVSQELLSSDRYVLPDYPIASDDRSGWIVYRKALRDCSKGAETIAQMLALIPSRPDGVDAFAILREREVASHVQE